MIFFKKQKLARLANLEAQVKYVLEAKEHGIRMTAVGFDNYIDRQGEIAELRFLLGLDANVSKTIGEE